MNGLRNIPWKHPKVWVPAVLVVTGLATLPLWMGDSLEDKHGRKPSDLPPVFRNAVFQRNGVLIKQLATPDYAQKLARHYGMSLAQGKQNNRSIPSNCVMGEYKIDEDHYLYHLEWVDESGRTGNFYRVRKINDEWKIEEINGSAFDLETKGLATEHRRTIHCKGSEAIRRTRSPLQSLDASEAFDTTPPLVKEAVAR